MTYFIEKLLEIIIADLDARTKKFVEKSDQKKMKVVIEKQVRSNPN
jgi:hypothetical protein